ncbi:uncharacterized protein LOC128740001 [Sabethes cyaneus]|uniref:uncharacterized protein LOC128740001 n=1 Tax=Sabethes cyaneus TaxID=53552 RepID=UPI00237E1C45|nr:uncharacterized protein LOC128740001 [Sabethes cyaneus]XP_053691488.1 uncharacterized protein LOC128740001 [Sabethes cyaneus]
MSSHLLMPNCCRCCLSRENEMFYVFDQLDEFESKISDVIESCGGITITASDRFSKQICSKCLNDLSVSERFRLRCLKTEEFLLHAKMDMKEQSDESTAGQRLEEMLCDPNNQIKIEDTNVSPESIIESTLAIADVRSKSSLNSNNLSTNSVEPYQLSSQSVSQSELSANHVSNNGFMPASGLDARQPLSDHFVEREHLKRIISDQLDLVKTEITNSVLSVMDALLAKTVAALKANCHPAPSTVYRPEPPVPLYYPNVTSPDAVHPLDEPGVSGSNFHFKPVKSAKELEILEQNLNDPMFARKLFDQMREKIGDRGDNYCGQNTCYTLIDNFFDRKFLVHCSWSGGSRSDIEKCAIKDCKNTLTMFYKIVRSTNKKFTFVLLEEFFKSVVRNAKRRSEAKGLRASTIHRRIKKIRPAGERSQTETFRDKSTREMVDLPAQTQMTENSNSEAEDQSYRAEHGNDSETSSKRSKRGISNSPTSKRIEH